MYVYVCSLIDWHTFVYELQGNGKWGKKIVASLGQPFAAFSLSNCFCFSAKTESDRET